MADEIGTAVRGPYGTAEPVPLEAYGTHPGVASYLLTAPVFHPLWSQYSLSVVSLAAFDGFPPAKLQFPGATHELCVVTINPEYGHLSITDFEPGFQFHHLSPVNIAEQFEATDEEMREVLWLAARAVVHGQLNPETADAPTRIRQEWLTAVVRTLAHIRGEEHAP